MTLIAAHKEAGRLLVHLDGLGRIDITGALALRSLLQDARAAGLQVEVVDVRLALGRARRERHRANERPARDTRAGAA